MSGACPPTACWGTYVTCDCPPGSDAPTRPDRPPGRRSDNRRTPPPGTALKQPGPHQGRRTRLLIHSAKPAGVWGRQRFAIAPHRRSGRSSPPRAAPQRPENCWHDMDIEHVYDSRSIEFRRTDPPATPTGTAVDIVLNSLTGGRTASRTRACWRWVDDSSRSAKARHLRRHQAWGCSRSVVTSRFYGVDLGLMSAPATRLRCAGLLNTVYKLTANGVLPIPEITHYPLAEAATAVRTMSTAQHTGKTCPRHRACGEEERGAAPGGRFGYSAPTAPTSSPVAWAPSGLFLAERMAAAGCGRIVLTLALGAESNGAGDNRACRGATGPTSRVGARATSANPRTVDRVVGSGHRHRASGARCACTPRR